MAPVQAWRPLGRLAFVPEQAAVAAADFVAVDSAAELVALAGSAVGPGSASAVVLIVAEAACAADTQKGCGLNPCNSGHGDSWTFRLLPFLVHRYLDGTYSCPFPFLHPCRRDSCTYPGTF